jgi:hypothetical protein
MNFEIINPNKPLITCDILLVSIVTVVLYCTCTGTRVLITVLEVATPSTVLVQ